jgi:hypothetical protein
VKPLPQQSPAAALAAAAARADRDGSGRETAISGSFLGPRAPFTYGPSEAAMRELLSPAELLLYAGIGTGPLMLPRKQVAQLSALYSQLDREGVNRRRERRATA